MNAYAKLNVRRPRVVASTTAAKGSAAWRHSMAPLSVLPPLGIGLDSMKVRQSKNESTHSSQGWRRVAENAAAAALLRERLHVRVAERPACRLRSQACWREAGVRNMSNEWGLRAVIEPFRGPNEPLENQPCQRLLPSPGTSQQSAPGCSWAPRR